MESEAIRGPGSIPILTLDFFHIVKASDAIIDIIAILSICEKPKCVYRADSEFSANFIEYLTWNGENSFVVNDWSFN